MADEQVVTRPYTILFVCTGNTCRSPMAAALARREFRELDWSHVEVRSAGIAAADGVGASEGALRAAQRQELDLSSHRSTVLTPELVDAADLILAMSPSHVARVLELGGEGRVSLLSAFAEGREEEGGSAIPDPFGGDDSLYEATLRTLEDLVRRSTRRLEPIVAP